MSGGRGGGALVVAGVVIFALAHAHGVHLPKAATTAAVSHGGTLSCSGLEALWESAGGSSGAAFTAAEIAEAESSGRQYAADYNSNGTVDRGYWQVNSIWGALSTFDAAENARAAVRISHDGTDWGPWTTYQTGAYQGQC
jgi:Lysozyme like domain